MTFDIAKFFAEVRNGDGAGKGILGPKLEPNEVAGCEAVLKAMAGTPVSHCAYALATAYHETARTMQPVLEAYWLSEGWRSRNLRYYPWHGRGYVQLTWARNYKSMGTALNLPLFLHPDLALRYDVAYKIMSYGMTHGTFTGVSLSRYINEGKTDYLNARKIINSLDKADLIAGYATAIEQMLLSSL